MRENRTYGSEGGVSRVAHSDPYRGHSSNGLLPDFIAFIHAACCKENSLPSFTIQLA